MQMSDNPLFDGQGMEFHHLQRLDQRKQSKEIQKLLKEQNKRLFGDFRGCRVSTGVQVQEWGSAWRTA
ncbi:MAG: hypothetical protein FJ284_13935 [Planctomycetes bacterium]|nr:hypothetical protein [Planctomycetota bacterium]